MIRLDPLWIIPTPWVWDCSEVCSAFRCLDEEEKRNILPKSRGLVFHDHPNVDLTPTLGVFASQLVHHQQIITVAEEKSESFQRLVSKSRLEQMLVQMTKARTQMTAMLNVTLICQNLLPPPKQKPWSSQMWPIRTASILDIS
jgi:hypothetical protein